MKIKICTPQYSGISPETSAGISQCVKELGCDFKTEMGTCIYQSRNILVAGKRTSLVRPELEPDYTHYLMWDADIVAGQEHVKKLLANDKAIVSAAYINSGSEEFYCAGGYEETNGFKNNRIPTSTTGLASVRWVGMGFCLIKREVFELLEAPWFRHEWIEYDDCGTKHRAQTGEDIGFCMEAEKRFDIFCDCDCRVGHLAKAPQAQTCGEIKKQERTAVDIMELKLNKSLRDVQDNIGMLCQVIRNGAVLTYKE